MIKDLQILKDKYLDGILHSNFGMTDEEKYRETVSLVIPGTKDGGVRFSDIDYTCDSRNAWSVAGHIYKTKDLALIGKRNTGRLSIDAKLLFLKALTEWLECDFINPNWWHNDIAVAGTMTDIGLLAWSWLDAKQKRKMDIIMSRGSVKYNYDARMWTGANQLWGTDISAKHAIIHEDVPYMKYVADRMYVEVAFAKEGIQKDGSYFQHGPRLYAGGYGRCFLSSLMGMLGKYDGTMFGLPAEKVDILEFHILDGLRWMIHKDIFDWQACGREFSRPGWGGGRMVSGAAREFCKLSNIPRRAELLDFADKVESQRVSVQGVKYFNVCDMICTHIDDVYIGFKGISPRTVSGEVCNDEGVLSYNTSYGTTTTVMKSGYEYHEIAPIWDWCHIPGTTAVDESDEALMKQDGIFNQFQRGDRFDGGQLGDCAWEAQTVSHYGVHAAVICFATPYGVVLVGNALRHDDNIPLVTTVEQCFYQGEHKADDKSVTHNGVKYVVLDSECKMQVKVEHRENSFKRVNTPMDDIRREGDVFEVTLDRPGDRYAYLIQPETQNGTFELLLNTEDIQALRIPDGRVFVHFFTDGKCEIDGKTVSGKAHDCLVLGA